VKSPCLQQSEFENLCFDGIITAMFETLQPPRPEPAKGWFAPTTVYGIWCVLAAGGILIGLLKHGTSGRVGFVCYATVLVLALYFLVAARTRRPTQREMSTRNFLLLMIANLHIFYMLLR
jgi:hypothetical protein